MASLLDLAQARLQGLLDIPTRAARAIVNPTAFSGLLGAPTLPQMQGTAEAAYGLPARQNMSVLDPKQAAYLQGYQQGEPLAYLGMATPFAAPAVAAGAKAVAPKAGMALENYMASQGLLQPLTAYHGTPHTIRGKFDISKVGTGEGAQAFGHGMYFAENPSVAKEYANKLGQQSPGYEINGTRITPEKGSIEDMAVILANNAIGPNAKNPLEYAKNRALELVRQNPKMAEVAKKIEQWQSEGVNLKTGGNLYKVDIPDAYIPNMLDWDKPLNQQPKAVQDALAKFDPDTYSPKGMDYEPTELGQGIYMRIANSPQAKNFPEASALLNSLGIKGVRYLDAGSRPTNVIDKRLDDLYQKHDGDIEKAADDFMRTIHDSPKKKAEIRAGIIQDLQNRPTSNFVVFDPTDVKILEKNSQKVEGLLD